MKLTVDPSPGVGTALFDGATIIWEVSDWLSLDIFDFVVAGGASSYYWLKGQDLIVPISYPRGIQAHWSLGEKFTLSTGFGVDAGFDDDEYFVNASLAIAKDEESSWGNVYFGWRQKNAQDYDFLALGLDFFLDDWLTLWVGAIDTSEGVLGIFGEPLSHGFAFSGGAEGLVSFGEGDKFSLAYAVMGGTSSDSRGQLSGRFTENLLAYVEPGYAITDYFALGLPLEYHFWGGDKDYTPASRLEDPEDDDSERISDGKSQIWAVPTLYFYPAEGSEIWVWYQANFNVDDSVLSHHLGMEVIWEF